MTLEDARRLQEKWRTRHGDKSCNHSQLINPLMSRDGANTGNVVCLVCGEVSFDSRETRTAKEKDY